MTTKLLKIQCLPALCLTIFGTSHLKVVAIKAIVLWEVLSFVFGLEILGFKGSQSGC